MLQRSRKNQTRRAIFHRSRAGMAAPYRSNP
jgi:hypothetical protein